MTEKEREEKIVAQAEKIVSNCNVACLCHVIKEIEELKIPDGNDKESLSFTIIFNVALRLLAGCLDGFKKNVIDQSPSKEAFRENKIQMDLVKDRIKEFWLRIMGEKF